MKDAQSSRSWIDKVLYSIEVMELKNEVLVQKCKRVHKQHDQFIKSKDVHWPDIGQFLNYNK